MPKTILLLFLSPLFLHAQWTQTNGLPGGNTRVLLNYGDTVLATVENSLFYSKNHGKTWTAIQNANFDLRITSSNGQSVFGSGYDRILQKHFWYRTDDFYQTIIPIAIPDSIYPTQAFFAFGHLYISQAYNALYKTNDNGVSWEKLDPKGFENVVFDGQRITGNAYPYILQSSDQGNTWDTLLNYQSGYVNALVQHENQIYASNDYYSNSGCYVSQDYGQTWAFYPSAILADHYSFVLHDDVLFGFNGNELIKSHNNGQTWEQVPLPPNSCVAAETCVVSDNVLIIGGYLNLNSTGIYRSLNGGDSWIPVQIGISASSGKLQPVNQDLFVPNNFGLYKLKSGGLYWENIPISIPHSPNHLIRIIDFVAINGNWVIATDDQIWYTAPNSQTWLKSTIDPFGPFQHLFIDKLYKVANKLILSGSFEGDISKLLVSADDGQSFQVLETLEQQFQTHAIAIDVYQDKLYAFATNKKIYQSTDGGNSWTPISSIVPLSGFVDFYSTKLHVNGNVIVVYNEDSQSQIAFSNDSGQTWQIWNISSAGLPWGNSPIYDLLHVGSKLLVSTGIGIWVSEDEGISWHSWNEGLLQSSVTDIESLGGYLWASTGGGIWKRSLNQLFQDPLIEERSIVKNDSLFLSPNPANQYLHIQTNEIFSSLQMIDVNGKTWLHQSVNAADIQISVATLPAGIYTLAMQGERGTQQVRLVVTH